MTAIFGDLSIGQHHNSVGHSHRRESVRDEERHLASRQFRKTLEHLILAARVERGGRLVQDE